MNDGEAKFFCAGLEGGRCVSGAYSPSGWSSSGWEWRNGGMEEWELDSSTGSIQSRQGKAEGFYLDMLMGTNEKKHALHVSASVKD